jgi:hypothetical protein
MVVGDKKKAKAFIIKKSVPAKPEKPEGSSFQAQYLFE